MRKVFTIIAALLVGAPLDAEAQRIGGGGKIGGGGHTGGGLGTGGLGTGTGTGTIGIGSGSGIGNIGSGPNIGSGTSSGVSGVGGGGPSGITQEQALERDRALVGTELDAIVSSRLRTISVGKKISR